MLTACCWFHVEIRDSQKGPEFERPRPCHVSQSKPPMKKPCIKSGTYIMCETPNILSSSLLDFQHHTRQLESLEPLKHNCPKPEKHKPLKPGRCGAQGGHARGQEQRCRDHVPKAQAKPGACSDSQGGCKPGRRQRGLQTAVSVQMPRASHNSAYKPRMGVSKSGALI